MATRALGSLLAVALGVVAFHAPARAEGTLFPGARPLGMGGALRAVATGSNGPMLNPSGISLMRAHTLDGEYQYGRTAESHDLRISSADSTSGFNLGGALYYAYHRASQSAGLNQNGHLAGGSLSFPFLDKVFLGANLKYVHFTDIASTTRKGFTFDAGLTVRPLPQLSLGAVGYNLREVAPAWTPRGAGGGIAFLPIPILLFAFDSVWTKVYDDPTRDQAWQFMGGGEFTIGTAAAIRAGGGRDGVTRTSFVTAGVTTLSAQLGAVDVGVRQDISGETKNTIVGVSARLFVPSI
jgi:hypothetical protein